MKRILFCEYCFTYYHNNCNTTRLPDLTSASPNHYPHPHYEPLTSIDNYWLSNGHITHCVLYIDKGLSLQQLKDIITSRLLSRSELARFKSRLVYRGLSWLCRSPFWVYDEDIDSSTTLSIVDNHVIEDEPLSSKKLLRQRLITLMSTPLSMDKPLWEIRYCAANYHSCDSKVVLIVRCHQTLSQSGLVTILAHYLADSDQVDGDDVGRKDDDIDNVHYNNRDGNEYDDSDNNIDNDSTTKTSTLEIANSLHNNKNINSNNNSNVNNNNDKNNNSLFRLRLKPRFGGETLSINIFRAIIVGPLTFLLWLLWAFTRRRHNYLTKSKDIASVHWCTLDLAKVYRIKQVTRRFVFVEFYYYFKNPLYVSEIVH